MPATLHSSLRALFGAWAGDRPVPLPPIPDDLPDEVQAVARNAVPMLAAYQGVAYARLYLQRLRRFIGRRDVDAAMFARIADLMAARMAYRDFIRVAQLVLDGRYEEPHCQIRVDDVIESLPCIIADPMLAMAARTGGTQRLVTLRYYPGSIGGRLRLRLEAGFRHWRGLSRHARRERLWVERWLHMIDRALTKQPAAAPAVIETATMIEGYGEPYRKALEVWHRVIDQLAKPVFDGHLVLPDLAGALAEARRDPGQIAAIRAQALRPSVGSSVACNSPQAVP